MSAEVRWRLRLARLFARAAPRGGALDDAFAADDAPIASLVAQLGLDEAPLPVRERPGWCHPELVLVTGASPARRAWLRQAAPDVELLAYDRVEEALPAAARADAIIGWHTPELIARATRLQWIQVQTAGVENAIDNPQIRARGILVTSLKRVAAPVIAEHVLALLLSATRGLRRFSALQRARRWSQQQVDPRELGVLRGRTLLVVGFGGIGAAVARLAHDFGMRIVAVRAGVGARPDFVDAVVAPTQLPTVVGEADFVVDALPLTDATRGMFDHALFERFKPGAMFVNVGRGETVVTDALVSALRCGRVGAAALDVTAPEPLPRRHPLWRMPNVTLTPHVSALSSATAHWGWQVVRENLRRYTAGERMLSVVDLERGY